jgi:hypothetical protein
MANKAYIYDAPAHHVLIENDAEYHGGEQVKLTEERASELAEQGISVFAVGTKEGKEARERSLVAAEAPATAGDYEAITGAATGE